MADRRAQMVAVFEDTEQFYKTEPILQSAVAQSQKHTKLYAPEDYPKLPAVSSQKASALDVRITRHKTFEAVFALHTAFPEKKIAVLNFASATKAGGGVRTGASAQEESLCRCSTLYPTLNRRWLWDQYYNHNKDFYTAIHTDACIYSPGVVICKTDTAIPERLPVEEFVTVDVISCAAPNLRREPLKFTNPYTKKPMRMDFQELLAIHSKRASHILHLAAYYGAEILVLGAFGCGVFSNDPDTVARAYRQTLDQFADRFDVVEFAIYCRGAETENYDAFRSVFA